MKKIIQTILFLFSIYLLFISCSKEAENPRIDLNGGEVFRSQVVVIDLPNVNLDQNEYQALFDGQNITLSKSDEHKLFFLVPNSTTLGEQDLLISSLNDVRIHYDVQEIVLTETVEVTMEPFFANLESFSQNLDTSPEAVDAQNALVSFNNYYSNTTLENKTELAILYKANKIMFDRVLQNVNITGKTSISNAECFGAAVIGMGASIPLLLAPTGATQITGVVLGGASIYYAIKCGKPLWNEYVLASFLNVNGILGTNQRNTFIAFSNDVSSTLSLNTVNRKLISSDSSRTESTWVYFFPYFDLLNVNIAKINDVIPVVNNFPFVNFPLIPLPASSPEVNTVVNQTIFSNIQFSVNHPNLQLVSSILQSGGQLNMKIKIIGTPTVLPVESFLNYTYSDDFSEFSGKLPIEVSNTIPAEIQFTMNGVTYNAPLISIQPSVPGTYCALRVVYFNDNLNMQMIISMGNYFDTKPIGTVCQFQFHDQYFGFYTPCVGNYTHLVLTFYDSQGSAIYPWRESLTGRGTLTKTGVNGFSFSGELASIEGDPEPPHQSFINESTTVQISGSGTY